MKLAPACVLLSMTLGILLGGSARAEPGVPDAETAMAGAGGVPMVAPMVAIESGLPAPELGLEAAPDAAEPQAEPAEQDERREQREQAEPARGEASWYGRRFHGRRTASGERFDMHALTAAHPSLPFGTVVRVEHEASGRSVDVRINDRGPHIKSRIIDLSHAAAKALGILRGTGDVVLRVLRRPNEDRARQRSS